MPIGFDKMLKIVFFEISLKTISEPFIMTNATVKNEMLIKPKSFTTIAESPIEFFPKNEAIATIKIENKIAE